MAKNIKDYKILVMEDLKLELSKLEKDYQEYRFGRIVGDSNQIHKLKKARKDIARVKTFIRQYELGIKNN